MLTIRLSYFLFIFKWIARTVFRKCFCQNSGNLEISGRVACLLYSCLLCSMWYFLWKVDDLSSLSIAFFCLQTKVVRSTTNEYLITASVYLFKTIIRNTRIRTSRHQNDVKLGHFNVFFVGFEHISHLILLFLSISNIAFEQVKMPYAKTYYILQCSNIWFDKPWQMFAFLWQTFI